MPLPYSFYRCVGVILVTEQGDIGHAPECIECRRREPGHPTRQRYLEPESVNDNGRCDHRIAPVEG